MKESDGMINEDFVELNDDGIAALRYATEYIWSNQSNGSYYNAMNYDPALEWGAGDLGL